MAVERTKKICNMYVVTRVKDSHWFLKWLPPYVEKKVLCQLLSSGYIGVLEALIMALEQF